MLTGSTKALEQCEQDERNKGMPDDGLPKEEIQPTPRVVKLAAEHKLRELGDLDTAEKARK